MDAHAQLLQTILRRETRSLLQYADEAFPWATSRQKETLAALKEITVEERSVAGELANWLAKKHMNPTYIGPYPSNFTNMNFVTLDFFLRLLIDYQKQAIAELERESPRVLDPEALGIVQKILTTKRRHLDVLTELSGGGKPQAA